ncbi:histone H1-like isoform X2 [Sander lucioperca]|uniref:histone H1-like isoform X2 n=1 Tax=Sander lucioperca TaxID=283035 RepID=UPI00125D0D83|nr:histone H1-like isoform X2 [Sander lucioperca]
MRRKATAKGAKEKANTNIKARENTQLKVIKQIERPTKTPTGKGLGKAGAKRLGRLLKRAIQDPEKPTVKGKVSLPKTPVRLFKHQIQTEAENAPKTNTAKSASPHVPQLILNVVSQCKHRGGISMEELKQTLAAGGYNVTKNNRRVNVVTQRLVNNDKLVRTTRNVTFRLNNEKNQVRTSSVKSPRLKGVLKKSKTSTKSSKEAEKRQARKTPKPKGKTRKSAAKSPKPKGMTCKPAAKSPKPKGKTRKPAAKSHKPRQQTPKARRKPPKPTGKKSRSATNCVARVRKAPRKTQRAQRRRPKQNRHPYKSSRKSQQPRPRLKTQQRRVTRRRAYYY